MINMSDTYQNLIYTSGRKFSAKATITQKDKTVVEIDNQKIMSGGVMIDDAVSRANSFDIRSAIIGRLTLVSNNSDETFNNYNFDRT